MATVRDDAGRGTADLPDARRERVTTALALTFVAWLVVAPVYFAWAAEPSLVFFGDTATEAEISQSTDRLLLGGLVAFVIGVALIGVSLWVRSIFWTVVHAALTLMTVVAMWAPILGVVHL